MTIRLLAIVLLFIGTACAQEQRPQLTLEQLEAIAIQPVKNYAETNSRVVPEMLPLFKAEKIVYTGKDKYKNTEIGFRLHVPENIEPGKKYPLILWLHGVGEAGTDNQDQLVHLHHIITYLTGPKKRDFFLLVPQTPKDHTSWDAHTYISYEPEVAELQAQPSASGILGSLFGSSAPQPAATRIVQRQPVEKGEPFEDSPLGFSFAMLDQVIANYPVDTDRITVSGLSSGGDGTWRALERRPEQFAAAVPLVSWNALKDQAIEKNPVLKKVPIWAIYSSDDNGIDFAREEFARIEAAGCNVRKSEFGVCGHNAWTPAMLQADIFSWLLSRAKKDGEYIAVVDANVNPEDMQGIVEVAAHVPMANRPTPAPALNSAVPAPPSVVVEIKKDAPPMMTPDPKVWKELELRRAELIQRGERLRAEAERRRAPVFRNNPFEPERHPAQDDLYAQLAFGYWKAKDTESFKRAFAKLSENKKVQVLQGVIMNEVQHQPNAAFLKELEGLIDQLTPQPVMPTRPAPVIYKPVPVEPAPEVREGSTPGSKIVEECEREWAMTSDSLYGMFPADWGKEGKKIPDFITKTTAAELVRILRDEPGKLQEACETILSLEHRPMSSPWFETSGGRLQSDIKYTLSSKGVVLVALLKASKQPFAQKTLEKIQLVIND